MVAQQNDDSFSDEEIRTLYNQQVNQGGYLLLNMGGCPREEDSTWDTSLGFWTKLFVCGTRIFTFTASLPDVLRKLQWRLPSVDSDELDRRDDGTGKSSQLGQRVWLERSRRLTARTSPVLKLRSILLANKAECCGSIFLRWPEVTERGYCRLKSRKFISQDVWNRQDVWNQRKRRMTELRQLGHPSPNCSVFVERVQGKSRDVRVQSRLL